MPAFESQLSSPSDRDPTEDALRALLVAACAREGGPERPERPLPEVMARLHRGAGAADDDELRALLCEVEEDVQWIVDGEGGASATLSRALSPDVRAAALERYATLEHLQRARAPSSPPSRLRSRPALRPRRQSANVVSLLIRAAAVLLLAFGVFLVHTSRSREAEAGFRLSGLDRLRLSDGRPELGSGRSLQLGERVVPGRRERLALRLPSKGTVLLADDGVVEVVRRAAGDAELGLRLDAGRARLRSETVPVELALGDDGTLVLVSGEACASVSGAPGGEAPSVWLPAGGEARWERPDGSTVPLRGPLHATLDPESLEIRGGVAPQPCRGLVFFGPARTRGNPDHHVSARRWRISDGRALRQAARIAAVTPVTLAWRPPPAIRDARRVRLDFASSTITTESATTESATTESATTESATTESAATDGAATGGGAVRVTLAPLDLEAVVSASQTSASKAVVAQGRRAVELLLPEGWFERLGSGELELRLEAAEPGKPVDPVHITFEGAAFARARTPGASDAPESGKESER